MRIDRRARKAGRPDYISTTLLTTKRTYAIRVASSLFEGRLRRHPEGGAGSGVLRRRLVTAGPGRPGTPPARHYDLAARSSLHGSAKARPRGPKPPRWSA